jgi:large subunit ribosomal protein L25
MTKTLELQALKRDKKENPKLIRKNGYIPAVVYGSGQESVNIKIKKQDFEKIYKSAGESTLIDMVIDKDRTIKVLIKDAQSDFLKQAAIHIDFYIVDMSCKITAEVHLNFIGISKAEKELGGVLVKNLHAIDIECLPGDLVNHIDVDLSRLEKIDDSLHIYDLVVSDKIKILNDSELTVVLVAAQSVETEKSAEVIVPEAEKNTKAEVRPANEKK